MAASSSGAARPPIADNLVSQQVSDMIDYQLWGDGEPSTSVRCFTNTGPASAQKHDDGTFRHYIKLESQSSFSVLRTVTLTEGPLKGYQVVVVDQNPPFRFLDLPREIRDEIYTYAMVPDIKDENAPLCEYCNENRIHFQATFAETETPQGLKRSITNCVLKEMKHTTEDHHSKFEQRTDHFTTKESLTPGLLIVSRQVYEEAVAALYGQNTFTLDAHRLDLFLKQIGPSSKLIRKLRFESFAWCGMSIKKRLLSQLVSLNCLSIEPWGLGAHYTKGLPSPLEMARYFYSEASEWISLVGELHADQFAAVRRINLYDYAEEEQQQDRRYDHEDLVKRFRSKLEEQISFRPNGPFPFLQLPRQVRNRIYISAMYSHYDRKDQPQQPTDPEEGILIQYDQGFDTVVRVVPEYDDGHMIDIQLRESLTPSLLLVSRQVYHEYIQILYGKNRFIFHRQNTLTMFLQQIGNSHVYLRSLTICHFPVGDQEWFKLLHLRELILPFYTLYNREFRRQALELGFVEHVYDPVSATHSAMVFYQKAISWIEVVRNLRGNKRIARIVCPVPPYDVQNVQQWSRDFQEALCGLIAS